MKISNYILLVLLVFTSAKLKAQTDTNTFAHQQPLSAFDYEKPTFKLEGEQLSNKSRFLRFSVVTSYREGVKPIKAEMGRFGAYADPKIGISRIAMINLSIRDLLAIGVNPAQLVFEVKDASKYNTVYCYEFVLPMGTFPTGSLFDFVRADIAAQFNLKVAKEKRMTDEGHRYGLPPGSPNKEVEVFIITELK